MTKNSNSSNSKGDPTTATTTAATTAALLSMKDINGSEVIASIKSRIRETRPLSIAIHILDELRQTKKLTFEQWADTMTSRLDVELDQVALFYCQKRFSNFEHIFDINSFVNLMDIALPDSYIDPKLHEDVLPQPYRMIAQIVEEDIVDLAWLMITRLHTEILLNSDGKPLCIPRNQPLQNTCVPTYISEKISSVTSMSAAPVGNYVFLTTSESVFSVFDPAIDRTLHAITLINNTEDNAESSTKCLSPWRISSLSDIDEIDSTIRLTVFCTIETMERKEAPPDPKAKKGAAAEAVLTPCVKGYLAVVEVLLDKVSKPGALSNDCLRTIAKIQFPVTDEAFESRLVCNISVDGLFVSVSSDTGCFVYELPSVMETKAQFKKMMDITEDSEEQPQVTSSSTSINFNEPVCQLPKYSSTEGVNLKAALLVPIRLPMMMMMKNNNNGNSKRLSTDNMNTQTMNEYNKTGLVILFDNLKSWELIGLKTKADTATISSDSSGSSGSSGPKASTLQNSLIGSWKLSGMCTAYQLSLERTILALGLDDGSIALWNILARSMTAVVARHEMFISSLSFSQSSYGNYLISAAFDGTVCFHQIIGPKDSNPLTFPGSDGYGASASMLTTCVSTKMMEYRSDVKNAHVSAITLMPGFPMAIVQYWTVKNNEREIMEVVYDVQNGAILGKFSLYYGISAQGVVFHPLAVDEVYHNYLKEGQHLNKADPSLDSVNGRRAKKYEEFPVTLSDVYFNRCISACSGDRLHSVGQKYSKAETLKSLGVYFSINMSNSKQVLCAYSLRTILSCFYAGISTLCLRADELNAEYLYGTLSHHDKVDPTLTSEKRQILQSMNDVRGQDNNRGDVNSRRSDVGSKTNTPSISRLTKEKLKELDMSFSHTQSITMSKLDDTTATLKQLVADRVLDHTTLALKSIDSSNSTSKQRKKRLANRLKDLSGVFS